MTTAAIHQPHYLPWMGYFEKMRRADVFVIFDDAQLPLGGHHYETRAMIQTKQGPLALNVPVRDRGSAPLIKNALLADGAWKRKHSRSILQAYGRSDCYAQIEQTLERSWTRLCDLNVELIRLLAGLLGIRTEIRLSSQLGVEGSGADKILGIVKNLGADSYVSGTGNGSRRYVNEQEFARHGIKLVWHEFHGPNLSAVDQLLRTVRGDA
jgi:hypothetical protein